MCISIGILALHRVSATCDMPVQIVSVGPYATVQCEDGSYGYGTNGTVIPVEQLAYAPKRSYTVEPSDVRWYHPGFTTVVHRILKKNESYGFRNVERGLASVRIVGCESAVVMTKQIVAQIIITDFRTKQQHYVYSIDDGVSCELVIIGTTCTPKARILYTGLPRTCELATQIWILDSTVYIVLNQSLIIQDITHGITYRPEWVYGSKVLRVTPDFPTGNHSNVAMVALVESARGGKSLWHLEYNMLTGTHPVPTSIGVEADAVDIITGSNYVMYIITNSGTIRRLDSHSWVGRVNLHVYPRWQHLDSMVCGHGIVLMDKTYGDVMYFSMANHQLEPISLFQPVDRNRGLGLWCDQGAVTRRMVGFATTIYPTECHRSSVYPFISNGLKYASSLPYYHSPVYTPVLPEQICARFNCYNARTCTDRLADALNDTTVYIEQPSKRGDITYDFTARWIGNVTHPVTVYGKHSHDELPYIHIRGNEHVFSFVRFWNIHIQITGTSNFDHIEVLNGSISIINAARVRIQYANIGRSAPLLLSNVSNGLIDTIYVHAPVDVDRPSILILNHSYVQINRTTVDGGVYADNTSTCDSARIAYVSDTSISNIHYEHNSRKRYVIPTTSLTTSIPPGWPINYNGQGRRGLEDVPCSVVPFDIHESGYDVDVRQYKLDIARCVTSYPHSKGMYAGAFDPSYDTTWLSGWTYYDEISCNRAFNYRDHTQRCRRRRECNTNDNEYIMVKHTLTSDTTCASKTVCTRDEYETNKLTHTRTTYTNRECAPLRKCKAVTLVAPTSTTDRICIDWTTTVDHPELGLKNIYQIVKSNASCPPPNLLKFTDGYPTKCVLNPMCSFAHQYHDRRTNTCKEQSRCYTHSTSTVSLRPCYNTVQTRDIDKYVIVEHEHTRVARALDMVFTSDDLHNRTNQIYATRVSRTRRDANNGNVDVNSNCTVVSQWCRKPTTCAAPDLYVLTPMTATTDAVCGVCAHNGHRDTSDPSMTTCTGGDSSDTTKTNAASGLFIIVNPLLYYIVIPIAYICTVVVIRFKYAQV